MNSRGNTTIPSIVKPSGWPIALASIIFSLTSLFLFKVYSTFHWKIMSHDMEVNEEIKGLLFYLLNALEIYRLFALLAIIWSIWAFWGRPKWLAWLSLPPAFFAAWISLLVQ